MLSSSDGAAGPDTAASAGVDQRPTSSESDGARAAGAASSAALPSGVFPLLLASTVVHGFGRGSKQLGIPTANMDMAHVGPQVEALPTGIYYGWAYLPERGVMAKACSSIGYNPQFSNKQKTVEPHLIHDFGEEDFYGEPLRFLICGYVRPEWSFPSLDALIAAIHNDIEVAKAELDKAPHKRFGTTDLEWTTTAVPPAEWRPKGSQEEEGQADGNV